MREFLREGLSIRDTEPRNHKRLLLTIMGFNWENRQQVKSKVKTINWGWGSL